MEIAQILLLAIVAVMTGLLVVWTAKGGHIARWIAMIFLISWIFVIGHKLLESMYPRLLYSAEEQIYMKSVVAAIQAGKNQISLKAVLPFKWHAVCFVYYPYSKPFPDEIEEVQKEVGYNITNWGYTGDEGVVWMVFGTSGKPVVMRTLEEYGLMSYGKELNGKQYDMSIVGKSNQNQKGNCSKPEDVSIFIKER